jgi:hypothetical protein
MNKISIIKKLQLGESSFPIDDLYSKVYFSFYCAKGGIKHQIFLSFETSNLLDDLVKNNDDLFRENEFQKDPSPYRYQIYNSQECNNNYLIIFDISEHRDYFSCHVNTVFQIEFQ